MKRRKTIIVIPNGGLCNRMRAINSIYQMPFGKSMIVFWKINDELGISTKKLFDLPEDIKIININCKNKIINLVWTVLYKVIKRLGKYYDDKCIETFRDDEFSCKIENKFNYSFVICDTGYDIVKYNRCNIFKPKDYILEKVKNIISGEKKYFSVHIRRTDNLVSAEYSRDELFIKNINIYLKQDKIDKFFLATDDKDVKNKFCKLYKNHIIVQQVESYDRASDLAIINAYVDLLCLAGGNKILGSYWSSFSDMAAAIGGNDFIVVK